MSALTGNQIKNSYQGLLKLADSSTGITQSFQALEDGLGNNTGMRIATNTLEIPSVSNYQYLKARFYGSGFGTIAGAQYPSGVQNVIGATPFYDKGLESYSAISFNVLTATSSSDTIEFGIYTPQMINPNGLFPYEAISTGITISLTGTGIQTYTFPTAISMSGYGGGIYFLVFKISNGGVQPTVRFGAAAVNTSTFGQANPAPQYGMTLGFTANNYTATPIRVSGGWQLFSGQTTFNQTFPTDMNTRQSSATASGNSIGMILHTVGA